MSIRREDLLLLIHFLVSLMVSSAIIHAAPLFEEQSSQDFTLPPATDWTSPPAFFTFPQAAFTESPVFDQTTNQQFPTFSQVISTESPVFEQLTSQSWTNIPEPNSLPISPNADGAALIHNATSGPVNIPPSREEELQAIKDTMVTGVTAIRDSLLHLITFVMGGAKSLIEQQVGKVADAVHNTLNRTAAIKDNILAAGSGIAQTFGHSMGQSKNITHDLFTTIFHGQPMLPGNYALHNRH